MRPDRLHHCFEEPDDDFMPGLWFCKCPSGIDLPALNRGAPREARHAIAGAGDQIGAASKNWWDAVALLSSRPERENPFEN